MFLFPIALENKRPCASTVKPTTQSQQVGVVQLDPARLQSDLGTIDAMPGNQAYSRYNQTWDSRFPGTWDQIVLGNWSGDALDGQSREYADHFQWTTEGTKVPYIRELVETIFRGDLIKSIRIFRAANAIIVSHKDYIEFKKGFRRLHIPLRTSASCMNSERAIVYRMKVGGIYFLDGREAHAGGNLGTGETRCHLVLDFDPDVPVPELFYFPEHDLNRGEMEFIERPLLNSADLKKLINGLAALVTTANYGAVMGVVNTLPFTHNFDTADVYDVLVEAAVRSGNAEVISLARADRKHFLGIE